MIDMLEDFAVALGAMHSGQAFVAIIGGILYSIIVIAAISKPRTHNEFVRFFKRRMCSLAMFYIAFPFAQGMMGSINRGHTIALSQVTLYYILFVFGFILSTVAQMELSTKKEKS